MSKEVDIRLLMPVIIEKLACGGKVTLMPKGNSMMPLLRGDTDSVVLISPPDKLKKYDVALYLRTNGEFVLHRVLKTRRNSSSNTSGNELPNTLYSMCGDNQFVLENDIAHQQIIAVMTAFERNGKTVLVRSAAYWLYCRAWYYSRPLRKLVLHFKRRRARRKNTGE